MNYSWSIPVLLAVALVGCSSGDNSASATVDGVGVPEKVRYLGTSHTSTFDQQTITSFYSTFFEYSEDVSVDLLSKIYALELTSVESTLDGPVCEIDPVGDDELMYFIPDEIDIEFVSAGDTLLLSSPQGTFADIVKLEGSFISPTYVGQYDFAFPQNIQLDIPGDVFPSMTVPFPTVSKLASDDFSVERPARLDDEFSWTAGADSDALMYLSFTDDPHKNWVNCFSRDNGKFVFPQNVIDHFGIDQPMVIRNMTRFKTAVHYTDNAMLIVSSRTQIFDN